MERTVLTLAGALALASVSFGQIDASSSIVTVRGAKVQYRGVIDASTGNLLSAPALRGTLGDPIYNNTALTNSFANLGLGGKVIDEGAIPQSTTAGFPGALDSYDVSSIQLIYATDAPDASIGGTGPTLRFELFESYLACSATEATEAPIFAATLAGLPGSTTAGAIQLVAVDLDLSADGVCIRGLGRDGNPNSTSQRFGFSLQALDLGGGTALGPILAGDPLNVPEGDGTAFINPGAAAGTGFGTLDLFRAENFGAMGTTGCIFFGGYPANPFSSFAILVRSSLSGECIGCGIGDDRFEENDDDLSAVAIEYGFYPSLINDDEEDWYEINVAAGTTVDVDLTFSDDISDIDLRIVDLAGSTLASSGSTTDNESASYTNCGTMDETVRIRVFEFGSACNEYDMNVALGGVTDDALEDNDSCATPAPLPTGLTRDLVVLVDPCTGTQDRDYYSVALADGRTLSVDIIFDDDAGDLDLFAYDSAIGCDGGTGDPETLDFGFSSTDNESIRVTNTTGATLDIIIRVDGFGGTFTDNTYDMIVRNTAAETFGEVICVGEPNSSTDGARLFARGSDVATDNNLQLRLTNTPQNVFSLYFTSQGTARFTPAGSDGVLCITDANIARFNDSLATTDISGARTYTPDLANILFQNAGTATLVSVMAGDTFNFQVWYRDGATTSNFSDAISVTFQ
ncbi:MAG: hypothetical protein AAFP22_04555 [Planctomycetota bacterium]